MSVFSWEAVRAGLSRCRRSCYSRPSRRLHSRVPPLALRSLPLGLVRAPECSSAASQSSLALPRLRLGFTIQGLGLRSASPSYTLSPRGLGFKVSIAIVEGLGFEVSIGIVIRPSPSALAMPHAMASSFALRRLPWPLWRLRVARCACDGKKSGAELMR